ncbi:MAG: dTDP-4-dehydrorhamnose reductase [Steroidobacteraceae bacterium]
MNAPLKVLITGAGGQLGHVLCATAPQDVLLLGVTHAELDIGDLQSVQRGVTVFRPDLIINAAAYTAVDKAEDDEAEAECGNVQGPRNLARVARELGHARLIHVSTDFVFDGSQSSPYRPDSMPAPLGVYGRTKLQGEQVVREVLGDRALIVRTAWVYGPQGRNFLRTMLRLMKERGAVRVVADQVGTPTCTGSLAQVLWQFARRPELSGIYHWTDAGVASWYDFAVAIAEEAVAAGVLSEMPQVEPIATHEFLTPVQRPAYSVLDKSATHAALGIRPVHWRQRLREVMKQITP